MTVGYQYSGGNPGGPSYNPNEALQVATDQGLTDSGLLDQFGLSPDEEKWLQDEFGVGGQVGLLLAQLGGYNAKLQQQSAFMSAQASYARIAADEAMHAGDLAEAKRYHDMQAELQRQQMQVQAEMDYTKSLMSMSDKPDMLFRYAFARYGLQPPQGGAPAQLPIPDFIKQKGMVLNPAQSNQQAGSVQTGVSQNPSLAALLPGANPNPQGVVQPTPPAVGPGLQPMAAGQPAPSLLPGANPTSREVGPFATQPILPHFDIPNKPLGPNTEGKDVVALQRSLERLGYFQLPPGANYGFYGPVTTAAVAKFQQDFGVNAATPGLWDKSSAQALTSRIGAIGNQPAGPSPLGVRGADVFQSPQGLPQQAPSPFAGGLLSQLPGAVPSMAAGSQPLPGQSGAPTAGQSNAAAQPGAQNFQGATQTLTPSLQGLFAQEGNAQSQIPIQPPAGYKYPDLGAISGQAYNRLSPIEQGQYLGFEHDIAGRPQADVAGDINKLSPQGAGLSEPTTFLAHGGLIPEPTVARGLLSGRQYVMGEAGPEQSADMPGATEITPMKKKPKPLPPQQLKSLKMDFHPSLMPAR